MNILFYYEELFDAAIDRMNRMVSLPVSFRNSLMITTEDIDLVAQRLFDSLGAMLCPQAAAELAGMGKLVEMDLPDNE